MVALTIMIAESRPEDMETIITVILNCMRRWDLSLERLEADAKI